jgi:tetratricopeptide (TPR) repeat protein
MTLKQHQEMLSLTGTVALLLGCVEYDIGLRREAEITRRAAQSLGEEAGNAEVIGWAHEMRAWYSLTQGAYSAAISAGQQGEAAASHHDVAVQLAAQQAKAWARIGDRRQVEVALDRGRNLLEVLPRPDDPDHHFVVDPDKFDFYAMDCYRIIGEDRLAEMYAHEVIRTSSNPDGTLHKPMRVAEAKVTLGVVAARTGDVERAVSLGEEALEGDRHSVPSLLMCSRELTSVLDSRYPGQPNVITYLDHVRSLAA